MKKALRFALLLGFVISVISLWNTQVYAKNLEPCYHCDMTGGFHCSHCNDRGEIECDQCGGKGGWTCPICDGDGFLVCTSCHGDGYIRSGDGEIPPDAEPNSCGHCGGSGKLGCITCKNNGFCECSHCDGNGKYTCQSCNGAKEYGRICPYCKGAKYLYTLPGVKEEWNDGVQNIPEDGDKIWVNGKSYTYHSELTKEEKEKAEKELADYKEKALGNLEKVFKLYNKKYYSTKEYKSLKSKYKKGKKAINASTDIDSVNGAYYKYKADLLDIKPSILDEYRQKLVQQIRKEFCEYSLEHLVRDEELIQVEEYTAETIQKLLKAKTRNKAKKIKKNYDSFLAENRL